MTPDREMIESVWAEAREMVKRLEGSTVQRFAVAAGEYKIEIERGAPAPIAAAAAAGDAAPLPSGQPVATGAGPGRGVEVGDTVDAGETVCIVEAMKMMNEVVAGEGGKVAEIVADSGEWVEFEQVLMYLEPPEA
jgi:acetyl-CoA carboxylase biotin carboxyl carrier protein